MIKFVFLDLDDTILDFHRSEAVALRKTLQSLNVNPTDEVIARYSAINLAHWKALERKELTREQVLTGRFRQLFEELGMNVSPNVAQSLYEKNLSESHFFIDGAPRLLMTLSKKYPLYIASNGTLFNMKFHPSALAGPGGLESFTALVRGYFDQKGSHMQFNVVSRETLRDAQKNPEKYKSLVVRVAGYSALFTTLSRSLQDDIINRTEQGDF